MHFPSIALLTIAPALALAHFELVYPEPRGEDESGTEYPCGGVTAVSERTMFPLTNAPVMIDDEHTEALVGVTIAMGTCDAWSYHVPSSGQLLHDPAPYP